MELKIREAEARDYEALCGIYAELDELHRQNYPELFREPSPRGRTPESFAEIMLNPEKALFIAEAEGVVVGFAECCILHAHDSPVMKPRRWVQLDGIAVRREYRRCNAGSALLEKVKEWAGSSGIERLELRVYSFNRDAAEFYEQKGFREFYREMFLNLS